MERYNGSRPILDEFLMVWIFSQQRNRVILCAKKLLIMGSPRTTSIQGWRDHSLRNASSSPRENYPFRSLNSPCLQFFNCWRFHTFCLRGSGFSAPKYSLKGCILACLKGMTYWNDEKCHRSLNLQKSLDFGKAISRSSDQIFIFKICFSSTIRIWKV